MSKIHLRGRTPTHPTRPEIVTEGRRRLLELDAPVGELAAKFGVSGQLVSHWRTGRKRPTEATRVLIERELGIPRGAWEVAAGEPVPGSSSPPSSDAAPASSSSSSVSKRTTLEIIDAELDRLSAERAAAKLPSDRARLYDQWLRTLKQRSAEEERVALQEDRVIRTHPTWRRLFAEIRAALEKHPGAAKDFLAAVRRVMPEAY